MRFDLPFRPLKRRASGFRFRSPAFFSLLAIFSILGGTAGAAEIAGSAHVLDGDTLLINGEKVRLFGVDAPERTQVCRAYGTIYPCGVMAIAWLVERTLGATVVCREGRLDRWRRRVAVCSVNGEDLAASLVAAGWAIADRRYSDSYVPREKAASEQRLGLWSGSFVTPLDWRRGERLAGVRPSAGR